MDSADGFAKKLCDGNGRQIRQPVRLIQGTGICHNDTVDASAFQSLDGRTTENSVSCSEIDPAGSVRADDLNRAADRAGSRNHVVEDQRGLAFDRPADQVGLTSLQRVRAAFVDDGQ